MKRYLISLSLAWLLVVGASFGWNLLDAQRERERTALKTARAFFEQVLITREWNARHGGVYVPVTTGTKPNPFLDLPDKTVALRDGTRLTLVNPAYMTRQIGEIAEQRKGISFHITSLNPIRPANAPSGREARALERFHRGAEEHGAYLGGESQDAFFYMAPLTTREACLRCHAKQGFEEGDIRGGISVRLPFVAKIPMQPLVLGHSGIALAGLLGILVFGRRLNGAYEEIRRQAVIDSLTGIPNRLSFSQRIVNEFKRCRRERTPLSILMCDVDSFKAFNDVYGHQEGDECLRRISQAITSALQRPGDFCARYGGEEFVIILPATDRPGAWRLAERLRLRIEGVGIPGAGSEATQVVTVSLGLATAEDFTNISHEELVSRADEALYRAKEKGRNRVEAFEPDPESGGTYSSEAGSAGRTLAEQCKHRP